jgi:hypothetical protein
MHIARFAIATLLDHDAPAESREFSDEVISRIAVLPISRYPARHDLLVAVTLPARFSARFSPQSIRRHAIVASSTKQKDAACTAPFVF